MHSGDQMPSKERSMYDLYTAVFLLEMNHLAFCETTPTSTFTYIIPRVITVQCA